MPTLQTAIAFFGVSMLLGITPGPDNIFVLVQSATYGKRAGMLVVLGLCTGLVVHTTAVAFGLAAVFAASESAFVVLKMVGAAYLAYLAWGAFRAPAGDNSAGTTGTAMQDLQLYRRGIFMNLTNPKVVFFFLAFLPQFVDASQGSVALQLGVLGAIFILATLVTFGAVSYFAATLGERLRGSAAAQQWMNRMAGLVFIGLALKLVFAQR